LSGNPLAVAAGLATLERLTPDLYDRLERLGARLEAGLQEAIASTGTIAHVQRVGSMITVFFRAGPVRSWDDAATCDKERFARFHRRLLEQGVYWPPAQFEAAFLSGAHTEDDIDTTIRAASAALTA